MVDVERVLRILSGVEADVARLADLADSLSDADALDAIKYRFVTAIEGASRAAHHIVVSEGWQAPDSAAAAFLVLAQRGVIAADLATELGRAVGFRNVLVHQYADVDDARVVAMLDRLGDLRAYVASVAAWLGPN